MGGGRGLRDAARRCPARRRPSLPLSPGGQVPQQGRHGRRRRVGRGGRHGEEWGRCSPTLSPLPPPAMAATRSGRKRRLRIAFVHPDLGLGGGWREGGRGGTCATGWRRSNPRPPAPLSGAERLIVDAAVELADRGHDVREGGGGGGDTSRSARAFPRQHPLPPFSFRSRSTPRTTTPPAASPKRWAARSRCASRAPGSRARSAGARWRCVPTCAACWPRCG